MPASLSALPNRDPVTTEAIQRVEEARTRVLLRTLLIIIGLTGLVSALLSPMFSQNRLALGLICVGVVIGIIVLLGLLQQNRVRLVAHVVVVMLFVLTTAMELMKSGPFSAEIASYLMVVVLAGVVLKPRVLAIVTLGTIVAIMLIALIRFPTNFATNIPAQLDVMSYAMLCVLMALIVYLSRRGLSKALASSEYYFESLIRTSRDIITVAGNDRLI